MESCSTPTYALHTSDQQFAVLQADFWQISPVLMEHSPSGRCFQVFVPKRTVEALDHLHYHREFPSKHVEILDLIALAKHLELKSHLKLCFDFYCNGSFARGGRIKKISECVFPPECTSRTAVKVWQMLCDSPPRTDFVYKSHIETLQSYSLDPAFIENITDIQRQKEFESFSQKKPGLPCPLNQNEMTVALLRRNETRCVTMVKRGIFTLLNIPGFGFPHMNTRNISDFFLVYYDYIIYRNFSRKVFFLSFKQPILRRCCNNVLQFLVKSEHVFLLSNDEITSTNHILKWNMKEFVTLNTRGRVGSRLDFNLVSSYLCYEEASEQVLRIDVLQNYTLVPYLNIYIALPISHFAFYNNVLYAFAGGPNFCYDYQGHPAAGEQKLRLISERVLESRTAGDELFLKFPNGWHVYTDDTLQRLSTDHVIDAINSVSLNPYMAYAPQ